LLFITFAAEVHLMPLNAARRPNMDKSDESEALAYMAERGISSRRGGENSAHAAQNSSSKPVNYQLQSTIHHRE
jgi:hypothetical protein